MASEITTAFVQQYKDNLILLSQQMGSRLRGAVRVETQKGEYAWYEQIEAVSAATSTNRHEDTDDLQTDTPHRAVRVGLADYYWVDYIDNEDKIRMLIDPTSPYARNAVAAFGRSIDDVLLDASHGNYYVADGVTKANVAATALPAGQKIAAGSAGLTVAKLIAAKGIFWANDVADDIPKYIAVTGTQLEDLLGTTEVTSADYNTVKALVRGDIDTFMGFKFIRSERVNLTSTTRHCVAWAQDGLLLALGQDIEVRIDPRPDKRYLTQVFVHMTIGGTRMEQEKVVQIDCAES